MDGYSTYSPVQYSTVHLHRASSRVSVDRNRLYLATMFFTSNSTTAWRVFPLALPALPFSVSSVRLAASRIGFLPITRIAVMIYASHGSLLRRPEIGTWSSPRIFSSQDCFCGIPMTPIKSAKPALWFPISDRYLTSSKPSLFGLFLLWPIPNNITAAQLWQSAAIHSCGTSTVEPSPWISPSSSRLRTLMSLRHPRRRHIEDTIRDRHPCRRMVGSRTLLRMRL